MATSPATAWFEGSQAAHVLRRLSEAVAWCAPRATKDRAGETTRSPELTPPRPFVIERASASRGPAWLRWLLPSKTHYDRVCGQEAAALVDAVCRKRADLLAAQGGAVSEVGPDLRGGRLLVVAINKSDWSGLTIDESNGFFADRDIPGWDTWAALRAGHQDGYGDDLLCWVPPTLLTLVDAAMRVDATSCLRWSTYEEIFRP